MLEDTGSNSDLNTIVEMCANSDKLRFQNQHLEVNVYNTQQIQQETTPIEEMKVLLP